jgi:hypothetical protein
MGEVAKEAVHGHTVERKYNANKDMETITGLARKYPW